MKSSIGRIAIVIGLLSLIHSGFSAAQHRSYLRLIELGFDYLPVDIIAQTLFSLILTAWGVTVIAGDFKEIRATTELENKSFESAGNRPSFYTFSHRGKVLSSVYSIGNIGHL
ncbi:ER membrane protein complex subunit 5 [Parasteatoda tepidariorum]|uniref:ER membrane protein complex subunit 5 n=1 Tax=Parasteatoda tepidariorum TaxID=114398 RepID=UPI00077FB3C7|nr:ER membrane protein complex subunit 5 [Parasteatoda tepidariorum]